MMNSRQRILHANINNQGGAFSLLYQVQKKLLDKYVFDYFSPNGFIENSIYQELQSIGSKCVGKIDNKNRFCKQYIVYRSFGKYLEDAHYDFVHIHADTAWKSSIYYLAAKRSGVENIIIHSHSSGISGHFRNFNYLLHIITRPMIKNVQYKCACSKVAAQWMYREDRNVVLIQNGVDIEKYKYDQDSRKTIRGRYGIGSGKIVIGTIGDYSYPKNPEFIARLINKMALDKRYVFILVGDGPGRKSLEERTRRIGLYNRVFFTGVVTDVEAYLSAMDVFILPSRFEGLPMSALEAQACGVYTIVSDKVTSETKCSRYFDVAGSNVNEWIRKIQKIKIGYDRTDQKDYLISKKLTIDETAKQFDDLYNGRMITDG